MFDIGTCRTVPEETDDPASSLPKKIWPDPNRVVTAAGICREELEFREFWLQVPFCLKKKIKLCSGLRSGRFKSGRVDLTCLS